MKVRGLALLEVVLNPTKNKKKSNGALIRLSRGKKRGGGFGFPRLSPIEEKENAHSPKRGEGRALSFMSLQEEKKRAEAVSAADK